QKEFPPQVQYEAGDNGLLEKNVDGEKKEVPLGEIHEARDDVDHGAEDARQVAEQDTVDQRGRNRLIHPEVHDFPIQYPDIREQERLPAEMVPKTSIALSS